MGLEAGREVEGRGSGMVVFFTPFSLGFVLVCMYVEMGVRVSGILSSFRNPGSQILKRRP